MNCSQPSHKVARQFSFNSYNKDTILNSPSILPYLKAFGIHKAINPCNSKPSNRVSRWQIGDFNRISNKDISNKDTSNKDTSNKDINRTNSKDISNKDTNSFNSQCIPTSFNVPSRC